MRNSKHILHYVGRRMEINRQVSMQPLSGSKADRFNELKPVFDPSAGKEPIQCGFPRCNLNLRKQQGLKRSNVLELFGRLEKLSSKPSKQINYDGVIDLLRLCQSSHHILPSFVDLYIIHYVFTAYSTLNIVSFVYMYIYKFICFLSSKFIYLFIYFLRAVG